MLDNVSKRFTRLFGVSFLDVAGSDCSMDFILSDLLLGSTMNPSPLSVWVTIAGCGCTDVSRLRVTIAGFGSADPHASHFDLEDGLSKVHTEHSTSETAALWTVSAELDAFPHVAHVVRVANEFSA